jgi:hypothetical protein
MFSVTAEQAQLAIETCLQHNNRKSRTLGILCLQAELIAQLEVVELNRKAETFIPAIIPFADSHFATVLIIVTPGTYNHDTEQLIFGCLFRYTTCCLPQAPRLMCEQVQAVYDVFCKPSTDFPWKFKEQSVYRRTPRPTTNQTTDGASTMGCQKVTAGSVLTGPMNN